VRCPNVRVTVYAWCVLVVVGTCVFVGVATWRLSAKRSVLATLGLDGEHTWQVMLACKYALCEYQCTYDELPYDSRGPEYALYKLRHALAADKRPEAVKLVEEAFDDSTETMISGIIDYANTPGLVLWDLPPRFVVFAESIRLSGAGRWVFFADGSVQFIDDPGCCVGASYAATPE